MTPHKINAHKCFDGWQKQYRHYSGCLDCEMTFSIYLPPQASENQKLPVIYWLSGLTCTDENFVHKAGAQRIAAELGVIIVTPDTSPRGEQIADDLEQAYDLGLGAGFYLNATQTPWAAHYKMYDYVSKELPDMIEKHFPVSDKRAISGHSMGGHGALVVALRNLDRYTSVSAFSPICNPVNTPWGQKAFQNYLGPDERLWQDYDASILLQNASGSIPMMVDQGVDDHFLETELNPEALEKSAKINNIPLTLRHHAGYDHSYYFIASFIEEHLRFHAQHLTAT